MAKKVIKIIPTKVGTAYSPTYAYQLLDYIVIDSVTVYICKRVDPNTMTSVGHPLTDTDWWDKGVDLSEVIDKAQMAISKAQVLSDKVTEAEKSRESAEKMRRAAEANRVEAEKKREIDFKQSKTSADDATRKALSTYSHPPYVDADGYYYKWNVTTDSYDKTDVNLTGKAFQIKKVFASVSAMNATDVNTFAENDFILINTANVEDEDNAKLYVVAINQQGRKFYSYLVDMSGFRGFTGKTPQIVIGSVNTLAPGSSASASLVANGTDTNGNPVYTLNFAIPKGDKITLADLTEEEIKLLQKPANDAIAACNSATGNANAATSAANTAAAKANAAADDATSKSTEAGKLNSKVAADEEARVKAESGRVSAEKVRKTNEEARIKAETAREANTKNAVAAAEEAANNALDTANHPTKVGEDNYVYLWNKEQQIYEKTAIYVKGSKGDKGDKGDQGIQGPQGEKGKSPIIKNEKWWLWDENSNAYADSGVSVSSDYQLTKGKVEGVLTGDITSHTHSKYALGTSLTEEMQRATAKEASLQAIIDIINGASTVDGSFRKAIADLIGGAPESLDTLKEIADKLAKDDNLHNVIEEAIAQKADKSTTLGGYGITDTYTKEEVATILAAYLTSEVARKTYQPIGNYLTEHQSLDGYVNAINVSGSGNAVTSVTKSGKTISFVKGATFLTSHQSLAGYATESWVKGLKYITDTDAAAKYQPKGNYLTSHQSLAGYAKTSQIPTKVSQLTNDSGFLTSHQSLAGYLKTADADSKYLEKTAKAASASTADNASRVNGHTVNADVPKNAKFTDTEYIIPTLSSAPTSSTLTYTDNGVAHLYRVGYMCRVKDSSAEHGYKFYQLYNITSNTTGIKAVWGEISGGDYNETVTVTLKSTVSSSDSKLNGAVVTVKNTMNGETQTQTQTWKGTPLVFKIPAINTYTVSVSRISEYAIPLSQSYTAGVSTSRNVIMTYFKLQLGIYIYDTDGHFTLPENWDTANNSKAVGVYVGTENSAFIIAPTYAETKKYIWGINGIVSGIITSDDDAIAKKDYAGELNTDKIIAQLGIGSVPAVACCRNYTFKNGKKGYLWSFGEASDAYNNHRAIDEAMKKIGGAYIEMAENHWTSTQISSAFAWCIDWGGIVVSNMREKSSFRNVRPVCSV